jgi:hypothetical protein
MAKIAFSRFGLYGTLLLLSGVIVVTVGQQWLEHPKVVAERFVAECSKGRIRQASSLLMDEKAFEFKTDGSITLRGIDGSSATLSPNDLPLIALENPLPQSKAEAYWSRQYHFSLASAFPATPDANWRLTRIHCRAVGGKISIEQIIR